MNSAKWIVGCVGSLLICGAALSAPALCPAQGRSDDPSRPNKPVLNRLKNRHKAPGDFKPYKTVKEFLSDKPTDLPHESNQDLSASTRASLEPFVSQGVVVEGYLVTSKVSGDESANCGGQAGHDVHVWLSDTPAPKGAKTAADFRPAKSEAMVVEPTPYWEAKVHSLDGTKLLNKTARAGQKVRVYGWVFYDPEHQDEVDQTRGSLWEIHPVTRVEVLNGEEWKAL